MEKNLGQVEQSINNVLFYICVLITLVTMVMMLVEFFSRGNFPPAQIDILYIGVLIIYSFHKESLRWIGELDFKKFQRKGEIFVYTWFLLALFLYLINFLTKDHFIYSADGRPLATLSNISFTALEVGGVFILTRIFKLLALFIRGKRRI